MIVLISSNAESLKDALADSVKTATVEAEYGEAVVEGSVLTLAHHGSRSSNPAPCLSPNFSVEVEAIGLSHFDLDSLGGVLAVIGRKPEPEGFWELAAFVDTHGPHKLAESGASDENVRRLYAYWAWSQAHRVMAPRDGSTAEILADVVEAEVAFRQILAEEAGLLEAGDAFRLEGEALNKRSFVQTEAGVVVRIADVFTNHLYVDPNGVVSKAVVAFNTIVGGVTISLADPIEGVSAKDIVQSLWGSEAGGHAGIAGSPRGKRMSLADLVKAFERTVERVASPEVLLPEGFCILRVTSDYYGNHPEYGYTDREFVIGLPEGCDLEAKDFKLSHGTGSSSQSWEDLHKVPQGSILWDWFTHLWEPFPENIDDI